MTSDTRSRTRASRGASAHQMRQWLDVVHASMTQERTWLTVNAVVARYGRPPVSCGWSVADAMREGAKLGIFRLRTVRDRGYSFSDVSVFLACSPPPSAVESDVLFPAHMRRVASVFELGAMNHGAPS